MSRLSAGFCLLAAALSFGACETTDPGAGSNTNWLRTCQDDAECGDLSCLCGVCTRSCDDDCSSLPGATCAPRGSSRVQAQCGPSFEPTAGLCLPACVDTTGCAAGQLCLDGSCLALLTDRESCPATAQLELVPARGELSARHGTFFSEALYLPVLYDARPADWEAPLLPAAVTARVTDSAGGPVEGCEVAFVTGEGSGRAFPAAPRTNESGEIVAYWVAGDEREQMLTAALVNEVGALRSRLALGIAFANDEGPSFPVAEATEEARPTTLYLSYGWPETASATRVVLSAATFPHHAFYSAIATDGFFAGLQNTSDVDASTDAVAANDRVLIASVWNTAEGDAQRLFPLETAPELDCQPHGQDLGGIRCLLSDAWELGKDYAFELDRRALALDEAPADYAELGYLTEPCAFVAGCVDYTLRFGTSDAAELTPVVAYRYASTEAASWFSSFVQPYASAPEQRSCLMTPAYDARFLPFVRDGDDFTPVVDASFHVSYETWHNEVCANYEVQTEAAGFRLVTGGEVVRGRPELPDEPSRSVTLP